MNLIPRAVVALVPLLALLPGSAARGQGAACCGAGPLITQAEAARHGLVRAWFAQAPVDVAYSRVDSWHLDGGRLYAMTDSGLITVLDAETGARLWTRRLGRPGFPAFGPGANDKYVGVVSGSRLYILDRDTGRERWNRELGSAPSSGPALTEQRAFVTLVTGRVEAYQLDDPAAQPWYYQSQGRTHLRPTTTGAVVSWPTSTGRLYVCAADDPRVLFRLETNDDIVTEPAEAAPYIYIASLDGNLYSMDERSGREQWRYSTGYPIESSPAVVGGRVYVASLAPALHAVDAATGLAQWRAEGVSHFAAQGKDRVYASDRRGNLLVLDLKTGQPLGRIRVAQGLSTIVNDQTDRVYLVSSGGLVQCLHELDAAEPQQYRTKPEADKADEAGQTPQTAEPPAGQQPSEDVETPADEAAPAAEAEEPPVDEPADEPASDDDDPFN